MTDSTVTQPRVRHQRIEAAPVAALEALFDAEPSLRPGDPLPPLWHWVALAAWQPASNTGPDGHPQLGRHLSGVGKPRRMFAGGRVDVLDEMHVGDTVRREERILEVALKSGRSGDFVVVQVETLFYNAAEALAVRERQDLIYRDPPAQLDATEAAPAPKPVVASLLDFKHGRWTFATDPTKLLRFSAATSNAHRIHYDLPYTQQVEGYPDLVVHGPLMTLAMAEVIRRQSRSATTFDHRAVRPLFCTQPAEIQLEEGPDETTLSVSSESGVHSVLTVRP
jgi:3-methylfumaryl-CoA hydratase